MNSQLRRGLLVILLGYLLLAAGYFIYLENGGDPGCGGGEFRYSTQTKLRAERMMMEMPAIAEAAPAVRNYASELRRSAGGAVDQKYEKIGTVSATTETFEADERVARAAVADFHGTIQGEALTSDGGARSLRWTIGVPPDDFDRAVGALRGIGRVESFGITKTDRTNAYLELRARSTTLEQARDALRALKAQGGKIDELVKLEHEILDLEGRIQDLGVQLGNYDRANELCTVRFNLEERRPVPEGHPHLDRLAVAIAWAAKVYVALLAAGAVGLLCLVLALVVAQKCRALVANAGLR